MQRVKAADNSLVDETQVYAEGDESQPVVALRILPPGEKK